MADDNGPGASDAVGPESPNMENFGPPDIAGLLPSLPPGYHFNYHVLSAKGPRKGLWWFVYEFLVRTPRFNNMNELYIQEFKELGGTNEDIDKGLAASEIGLLEQWWDIIIDD